MAAEPNAERGSVAPVSGPIAVFGFATAVAMWCLWLVTHHPAVVLPAIANVPLLLACLFLGALCAGRFSGASPWKVGLGTGLTTSLLNLLILGAFLVKPPTAGGQPAPGFEGLIPSASVVVPGFLGVGAVIGLIGAAIGSRLGISAPSDPKFWLARFAVVAAVAVVPLLVLGAVVTSTASGMAVPGWPDSYGANMFLYPVSLMGHPRIFLEHSHRLFGAMVGVTLLTAGLWTVLQGASRGTRRGVLAMSVLGALGSAALLGSRNLPNHTEWGFACALLAVAGCTLVVLFNQAPGDRFTRILALTALALVIVQGYLGGRRVNDASPYTGAVHGIAAQILFGMVVMLAARLSPVFDSAGADRPTAGDRPRAAFAAALLCVTILQLSLGALYRHVGQVTGSAHWLWAHAGFSILVVIPAVATGFSLRSRARHGGPIGPLFRRLGTGMVAVVFFQFLLGWAAFFFVLQAGPRGAAPQAAELDTAATVDPTTALIATIHQANGALLLAQAALATVFTRRVRRAREGAQAPARERSARAA